MTSASTAAAGRLITTGVPPLNPISNLCPLITVNPCSLIPPPSSHPSESNPLAGVAGLITLLFRRYANTRSANVASRAIPPIEPTTAGTIVTAADLVVVPPATEVVDVAPEIVGLLARDVGMNSTAEDVEGEKVKDVRNV